MPTVQGENEMDKSYPPTREVANLTGRNYNTGHFGPETYFFWSGFQTTIQIPDHIKTFRLLVNCSNNFIGLSKAREKCYIMLTKLEATDKFGAST